MDSNEQHLLKKLGIPDWRYLSKDKFMKIIAVMPEMSNDIRRKIIEQIPQFTHFFSEGLDTAKESFLKVVDKNQETTAEIISRIDLIRENIAQGLNREDVSSEERKFTIEKLMEIAKVYDGLDARNKKFFENNFKKLLKVVALMVGAVIVIAGGKILISLEEDSDKS